MVHTIILSSQLVVVPPRSTQGKRKASCKQCRHNIEKYTRAKGYEKDRAQSLNLKRNSTALDKPVDTCPLCALYRDAFL
jgi:hypothetical protein